MTKARTAGNAISRMPRKVREEVSRALVDGADSRAVRKICEAQGYPGVRAQNVTNYRKGAHQDWLRREERIEALRRDSEMTAEVVRFYSENGGSPAEAGLLAGAEMLSRAIAGMGPDELRSLIADDPKAMLAMMRELSRVAEMLRKTDRKTEDAPVDDAPAMSAEEQQRRIIDMVDAALGLKK